MRFDVTRGGPRIVGVLLMCALAGCHAHPDRQVPRSARPSTTSMPSPSASPDRYMDACAATLDEGGDLAAGVAARFGNLRACGYVPRAETIMATATGLSPATHRYTGQGAIGFYDCKDDGRTRLDVPHPFRCWQWVAGPCPGLLESVNFHADGVPVGDLTYVSGSKKALSYFDVATRRFALLHNQHC